MKPVYENLRAWRVRISQGVIWLGAGLCLWLALFAPLAPTDASGDRIVASVGAILMVCAVVAFELYLRLYVLRIERRGSVLLVTTLATLHHRHVIVDPRSASLGETRREKAGPLLAPGYDNSWRGLKAKGHLLPFIIDTSEYDT